MLMFAGKFQTSSSAEQTALFFIPANDSEQLCSHNTTDFPVVHKEKLSEVTKNYLETPAFRSSK